jgi:hypothetical protein
MARTFTDILADDVANAFVTDFAGDDVQHLPRGVAASAVAIAAVVVHESSERVHNTNGETIVRRARLKLAQSIDVSFTESHRACDTFLIDGQLWRASHPGIEDGGMQTVHITREEPITTKQTRVL